MFVCGFYIKPNSYILDACVALCALGFVLKLQRAAADLKI